MTICLKIDVYGFDLFAKHNLKFIKVNGNWKMGGRHLMGYFGRGLDISEMEFKIDESKYLERGG